MKVEVARKHKAFLRNRQAYGVKDLKAGSSREVIYVSLFGNDEHAHSLHDRISCRSGCSVYVRIYRQEMADNPAFQAREMISIHPNSVFYKFIRASQALFVDDSSVFRQSHFFREPPNASLLLKYSTSFRKPNS